MPEIIYKRRGTSLCWLNVAVVLQVLLVLELQATHVHGVGDGSGIADASWWDDVCPTTTTTPTSDGGNDSETITPNWNSLQSWIQHQREVSATSASPSSSSGNKNDDTDATNDNDCPTKKKRKKKILLIGVDGLRSDAAGMLPLPNIRRLERWGTYSYWANVQTTGGATSGPGWVSVLTGVESSQHSNYQSSSNIESFPSIFRWIQRYFPQVIMGATCTWHPIITHYIEPNSVIAVVDDQDDDSLVQQVCLSFQFTVGNKNKFLSTFNKQTAQKEASKHREKNLLDETQLHH